MRSPVYLWRLLEVAARVDNLCPAARRKEGRDDINARRLPLGHYYISYEDVYVRLGGLDRAKLLERMCLLDVKVHPRGHTLLDQCARAREVLYFIIKYSNVYQKPLPLGGGINMAQDYAGIIPYKEDESKLRCYRCSG